MKLKKLFSVMLCGAMMASFTACENGNEPNNGSGNGSQSEFYSNGHEYVDLGLPSGLLWATCNVGANSPEEYGDYFAWGETTTKEKYSWDNKGEYKWGVFTDADVVNYGMTKYNETDGKTILEFEDDAARVNWSGNWRMPTIEEVEELAKNCTWTWIALNGVNGYEVKGSNGNYIFLPASGTRQNSKMYGVGSEGMYWNASRYSIPVYGGCLGLASDYYGDLGYSYNSRCIGCVVRPVCSPK